MILSNQNLSLKDFDRISFILYALKFNSYLIEFELAYENYNEEVVFNKENQKGEEWLLEFCNQLPSDTLKFYFKVYLGLNKEKESNEQTINVFNQLPEEYKAPFLWLMDNIEDIDRLFSNSSLLESEIDQIILSSKNREDYYFMMLALYKKIKNKNNK